MATASVQVTDSAYGFPDSVIIIGAGVAGIKVAHVLLKHCPDITITILEANSYIGGRVRSLEFEGHSVEMGANWISGLESKYRNPIWDLAEAVRLQGHFVDRGEEGAAQVVDSNGNDIADEYFASRKHFEKAHERAVKACVERKIEAHNDVDVRSLLEQNGWKPAEKLTKIERLVEFNMLEVWATDSLSELSATFNMDEGANDVDLGLEEFFVEDSRGFNCIMDAMVEDLRNAGVAIHLGSPVESVTYKPGHVSAIAKRSSASTEFKADLIVCTVSLGVLQQGMISFSPPLPDWKTKALGQVGMFLFSKVYAKFDHDFWSKTKNQIIICSDQKGYYPLWMRYRHTRDNLFMCYVGGREAKRIESLSIEQLKDEIEDLFRSALGGRLSDSEDPGRMFRPSAVAVTDWSRNPYFCGSYSVFPPRAFASVPIEDLGRRLTGTAAKEGPPTLCFAGEGYDDQYNGWIQGAFRSGERVARSILGLNEQ